MCGELVEIETGGCSDVGNVMSICRELNSVSDSRSHYGKCLKENNIDSSKVCTLLLPRWFVFRTETTHKGVNNTCTATKT